MDRLQKAVAFAARAHVGHVRKDGVTPYVSHPVRVAFAVSQQFGCHDEDVLAAAVLHDTIEDTTTDHDDLSREFGRDVADMVAALSKDMRLPEPEREQAFMDTLMASDWRVRLIKMADAYDSLCDSSTSAIRTKALAKARHAMELGHSNEAPVQRALAALESRIGEAA